MSCSSNRKPPTGPNPVYSDPRIMASANGTGAKKQAQYSRQDSSHLSDRYGRIGGHLTFQEDDSNNISGENGPYGSQFSDVTSPAESSNLQNISSIRVLSERNQSDTAAQPRKKTTRFTKTVFKSFRQNSNKEHPTPTLVTP